MTAATCGPRSSCREVRGNRRWPRLVRAWSVTGTEPAGLNGIAMAPAKPDYAKLVNSSIEEPPFTGQPAGVILLEPDGRVWAVSPKNEYGGYRNTFRKGQLDPIIWGRA